MMDILMCMIEVNDVNCKCRCCCCWIYVIGNDLFYMGRRFKGCICFEVKIDGILIKFVCECKLKNIILWWY